MCDDGSTKPVDRNQLSWKVLLAKCPQCDAYLSEPSSFKVMPTGTAGEGVAPLSEPECAAYAEFSGRGYYDTTGSPIDQPCGCSVFDAAPSRKFDPYVNPDGTALFGSSGSCVPGIVTYEGLQYVCKSEESPFSCPDNCLNAARLYSTMASSFGTTAMPILVGLAAVGLLLFMIMIVVHRRSAGRSSTAQIYEGFCTDHGFRSHEGRDLM